MESALLADMERSVRQVEVDLLPEVDAEIELTGPRVVVRRYQARVVRAHRSETGLGLTDAERRQLSLPDDET